MYSKCTEFALNTWTALELIYHSLILLFLHSVSLCFWTLGLLAENRKNKQEMNKQKSIAF